MSWPRACLSTRSPESIQWNWKSLNHATPPLTLNNTNPFNGIERKIIEKHSVTPPECESIQWNWKKPEPEPGTAAQPLGAWIHSMELKESVSNHARDSRSHPQNPFNGIESRIYDALQGPKTLTRNPFNGIESWGFTHSCSTIGSFLRIHSMELKGRARLWSGVLCRA